MSGMLGGGSKPDAPDIVPASKVIAEEERYNRPDIYNPYQTSKYETDAQGNKSFVSTMTEPTQKAFTKASDISTNPEAYKEYQQQVKNIYTEDLNKDYDRQRGEQEASLRNRGIPSGSEQWNNEIESVERARGEELRRAEAQSIQQAEAMRGADYGYSTGIYKNFQQPAVTPLGVQQAYGSEAAQKQQQYQQELNAYNSGQQGLWSTVGAGLGTLGAIYGGPMGAAAGNMAASAIVPNTTTGGYGR